MSHALRRDSTKGLEEMNDGSIEKLRARRKERLEEIRQDGTKKADSFSSTAKFMTWLMQFLTDNMSGEDDAAIAIYIDRMDIWESQEQRQEFRNNTYYFRYGAGKEDS